jgi:hypothetical protein
MERHTRGLTDMISQYTLDKINAKRREQGRQPLSLAQASSAANSVSSSTDSGSDFLFSYLTGIPLPSLSGFAGAAMHTSAYDSSPSSSSYDSSSSSSSYDSGSSSSSSFD